MRVSQRLISAAVLISLAGALAGCSSGFSNFDPTDMFDWLDTKKKLPGDRKPVFPDGVPGLEQGVPKDLYKGASQQQIDQQNAQAAAPQPEEPTATKSKGKKSKPAAPGAASEPGAAEDPAATDPNAAPADEGGTAAAPPAPKPKKIVRKRTTAPPPDAQAGQPADQSSQQQSAAPFPAPVPSGTFSR